MKKIISFIAIVIVIAMVTGTAAYAKAATPTVNVNNKEVKYAVKPYMKGNDVMIPVRQTVEALGAKVEYNEKAKLVLIKMDNLQIELPIGKKEFYVQEADNKATRKTIKINTAIKREKSRAFVPAVKFFEGLGIDVKWDSKKLVLNITKEKKDSIDLTKGIPYTVISKEDIKGISKVAKWYDTNYTKKGVHFIKHDGVIYALVAAGKKPTGGYSVEINKASYITEKTAYINASVISPSSDMMVTQVISYPHMLIKITNINKLNKVEGKVTDKKAESYPVEIAYEVITYDYLESNNTLKNWYNSNNIKPGISYIRDGEFMYVLIAAGEKPTGGYSISLDELLLSSKDTVSIKATIVPPAEDSFVIMMLTYPSKLIRIKSDSVKKVKGDITDPMNTADTLISLDAAKIKHMELLDSDLVKIKDLTGNKRNDIIKAFNEATINQDFYIMMITGNILKISTTDGYTLSFSSYGSDKNVVVTIEKEENSRTFHITAPVIAKLLLDK